jgi:hypothetical protein
MPRGLVVPFIVLAALAVPAAAQAARAPATFDVTIAGAMKVSAKLSYDPDETLCGATTGTFDESYSYRTKAVRLRLLESGTGSFSFFDSRNRNAPDLPAAGTVKRTIGGGLACDHPGAKCGSLSFNDLTAEIDLERTGSSLRFVLGNGAQNADGYENCPSARTWVFPSIPDRVSITGQNFFGATASISRLFNPRVPRVVVKFTKTFTTRADVPRTTATTTTSYTVTLVRRGG